VFLNGRSLSCLVCPQSTVSCFEQKHPLQRHMTYDELLGKYARKINCDQYDAIGIYTCPHCGLERLTIDALYDHLRGTYLPGNTGPSESRLVVLCPVCVSFRLDGYTTDVRDTAGLVEHMLRRHCFSSTTQYSDEFKLRTDFCNDDEFELIRFLATFLPPSIITAQSARNDDELSKVTQLNKNQMHQLVVCPICLEDIENDESKDLPLCHHQFHGPCIERWLVERKCCPICRCDCTAP
ncbi:uncharacterized protein LOC131284556, partial [Anopheles ziemanni]|uniref:uncharacterized protein LOC131271175 n=1 Tax=Anopheles coustani TaxID=139045 RepID=UPI0026597316